MKEKYFDDLRTGTDLRGSLLGLRELMRSEEGQSLRGEEKEMLLALLENDDPKVRRGAALILGETGDDSLLDKLMEAYRSEEKLFIRSDLLSAISDLDYEKYLPELKERLSLLMITPCSDEEKKHLKEEERALRSMIFAHEPPKAHSFLGGKEPLDIILITSPGLERLSASQLGGSVKIKPMKGAVFAGGVRIDDVSGIRTVKSFLFVFSRKLFPGADPKKLATDILAECLAKYISGLHGAEAPHYFRIDLRSDLKGREKSRFISALAEALETGSEGMLINTPSFYEFTLRLVQRKEGGYMAFVESNILPDNRFSYRKNGLPSSTHPVRAAEIVALAGRYLRRDADILDPFCGVGTLLIERDRALKAAHIYGVDKYGEAVRMAAENAELAGTEAYFINRDMLHFVHKYRFHEIITELPAISAKLDRKEIEKIYGEFVLRLPSWIAGRGILIVAAPEPDIFLNIIKSRSGIEILEKIHLSGNRGDMLIIARFRE